jgi:predicted RND superfamily exporter protein
MADIAVIVVGVGLAVVVIGVIVTLVDWWDKRKASTKKLVGADLGLDDDLNALQKLLVELAKHPVGTGLIVFGIVLMLIGGMLGGVGNLTE